MIVIQRMDRSKDPGDGGGPGVGVGSFVLARYSVDNALYRARVEDIIDEEVFSVRYIDYGNSEDCLSKSEIYTWDRMLEVVPPQAVSCCFYGTEESFSKKSSLTIKEMEAFTSLMKKSSPMQMVVHKRSSLPHEVFNTSVNVNRLVPELTVSLRGKDGQDILKKLYKLPAFSCLKTSSIAKKKPEERSRRSTETIPTYNLLTPTYNTIKQLESLQPPTRLQSAPTPLHLKGVEPLALHYPEDPPSPVHPVFTSKAVEKVCLWLDQKVNGVEDGLISLQGESNSGDVADVPPVTNEKEIEPTCEDNLNSEVMIYASEACGPSTDQATEPDLGEIVVDSNRKGRIVVGSNGKQSIGEVAPIQSDQLAVSNHFSSNSVRLMSSPVCVQRGLRGLFNQGQRIRIWLREEILM